MLGYPSYFIWILSCMCTCMWVCLCVSVYTCHFFFLPLVTIHYTFFRLSRLLSLQVCPSVYPSKNDNWSVFHCTFFTTTSLHLTRLFINLEPTDPFPYLFPSYSLSSVPTVVQDQTHDSIPVLTSVSNSGSRIYVSLLLPKTKTVEFALYSDPGVQHL